MFNIKRHLFGVLVGGVLIGVAIASVPSSKDWNVIFVAFDGLQARHLHAYGYPLETTPNLDRFLAKSYLFERAISPAPWTVPTYISIFTSMYPSAHKVVNKFSEYDKTQSKAVTANLKNLTPQAMTLAEILKKQGYLTAGFTGDAGASTQFGTNQGFDEYYEGQVFGGFDNTIPKALEWLQKHKDEKFFLFLHGYDVHGQHEPPGGFDYRFVEKPYTGTYTGSKKEQGTLREKGLREGRLNLSADDVKFWRAIYDEKIARADADFQIFVEEAEKLSLFENTIFVLFSDHGTEFYEHERFDHGHTLYGELLEVLFAIRVPGQKEGKRIGSLVSTLDSMPTTLELLGIENPVPGQMKGIDLAQAFRGRDVSREIFSETDYRLYTHKRSIQTPDGWKLILTMNGSEKELYNMNEDPGERANLSKKEPRITYELEQKILRHLNEMGATGPWILGCSPVYGDQCQ